MKKKITLKWLKRKNACVDSVKWFENQTEKNTEKVFNKLIIQKHFDFAGWLLVNLMDTDQKKKYAWIILKHLVIGINDDEITKIFNILRPDFALTHVLTRALTLAHALAYAYAPAHVPALSHTRVFTPTHIPPPAHVAAVVRIIKVLNKGWDILTDKKEMK